MKIRVFALTVLVAAMLMMVIQSCEKHGDCSVSNVGGHGKSESHNMGQNCMSCHKSGGQGKGCFQLAGTIYNNAGSGTYANATVKLYTQPNGAGTLVATVDGDSKGNAYTTDNINFGSGLYPVVVNAAGQSMYMSSTTTNGSCNSCHGVTEGVITTF
ncbi:MAG: hypothetical protein U0T73_13110 [Chitinophagales bacterium]